jgi:hypothetical protein
LLPGNNAFRGPSAAGLQYASLIGPRQQPSLARNTRLDTATQEHHVAVSPSGASQPPSRVPFPLPKPRVPIPVVSPPSTRNRLPASRLGTNQSPSQLSRPPTERPVNSSYQFVPTRVGQQPPAVPSSARLPTRPRSQSASCQTPSAHRIPNTLPNPDRRTPRIFYPVGLNPGRSAIVGLWDPYEESSATRHPLTRPCPDKDSGHQDHVASTEAFPSLEEEEFTTSEASSSSDQQESPRPEAGPVALVDQVSPIGALIARDRPRSSSVSSDESTGTVVLRASGAEDSESAFEGETADVPEHLRNPRIHTARLPENTYDLLEKVKLNPAFDLPSQSTGLGVFTIESPIGQFDIFQGFQNSLPEDSQVTEPLRGINTDLSEQLELRAGAQSHFRIPGRPTQPLHQSCDLEKKYYNQSASSPSRSSISKNSQDRELHRSPSVPSFLEAQERQNRKANTLKQLSSSREVLGGHRQVKYHKGSPQLNTDSCKPHAKMSFSNYSDQPSGGPGTNPRQAPPSPSQGAPHTNGMNGGMGMGGGMVGYPTPAGHQSDLNYLMTMVEDLSSVLAYNQRLTNGVVEKMGKVREKAANLNLTNDELLQLAAAELNGKPPNFPLTSTALLIRK